MQILLRHYIFQLQLDSNLMLYSNLRHENNNRLLLCVLPQRVIYCHLLLCVLPQHGRNHHWLLYCTPLHGLYCYLLLYCPPLHVNNYHLPLWCTPLHVNKDHLLLCRSPLHVRNHYLLLYLCPHKLLLALQLFLCSYISISITCPACCNRHRSCYVT